MLRRYNRVVAIAAALLLSAPTCFDRIFDSDIGFHLALGRLVSESGIPFRNALTWTAPNTPWYATSWLYELFVFKAMQWQGILGLQLTVFLFQSLTLVGIALAAERVDRQVGPWMAPVVALLLLSRITVRPHMVTWAVLAWTLFLCVPTLEQRALRGEARDAATWRRRLFCLPLIALASNLHQGALFAAAILAVACLENFVLGTRRWRELALAACGVAALFANPGVFASVEDIFKHLRVQNVVVLSEFQAPTFARESPFFLLAPLAVFFAFRLWRSWPSIGVITLAFAFVAFRSGRMVYEFELVAAIALTLAFVACRANWGIGAERLLLGALFLALSLWRIEWLMYSRVSQQFEETQLPVRAAEFIRAERLDGRYFNSFADGGYLEWALPGLPAFQDGRPMAWEPDFFAGQIAAEKSPASFRAWLGEWGVEWAVVTRRPQSLSGWHMLESPEWALVYWDDANEIYVKRDVARFAPLITRLEYRRFRPFGSVVDGLPGATRAELTSWLAEVERFQRTSPKVVDAWIVRCGLLRRLDDPAMTQTCEKAVELAGNERQMSLLALMHSLPIASQ